MERAEWLKKWRGMAEALYDHGAPANWVKFGLYPDPTHRQFIEKFLGRLSPQSAILDAACGAGLYDGLLLEAGHSVLGIDQSDGMLVRAREHHPQERFPGLRYTKMGLQEMDFQAAFDGAICMDTLEHICTEDWLGIVEGFHKAIKPGAVLYVTVDVLKLPGDAERYERAKSLGLPVVFGEIVDELDEVYRQAMGMEAVEMASICEKLDLSVYHYHPAMEQVWEWYKRAGFSIEEEEEGEEYVHVLARKKT